MNGSVLGDYPSLFQNGAAVDIDLPEYDLRQKWQARDGLCGIEAFRIWILRVLPLIFGMRMCPFCPNCNHHDSIDGNLHCDPCQDMFGSNMLAGGGFCGGADAFGGAVEHQHDGNPHFHLHMHLVNMYQHGTLQDVAAALKKNALTAETLQAFHMHICNEEHPDIDARLESHLCLSRPSVFSSNIAFLLSCPINMYNLLGFECNYRIA